MSKSYNLAYQREMEIKDKGNNTFVPIVETDNGFERALIEDGAVVIKPDTVYTSSALIGKQSKVGVGVHLSTPGKFRTTIYYTGVSTLRPVAAEFIVDTKNETKSYGGGVSDKVTNRYNFTIRNTGDSDIVIRDLIVTEFN